MNNSPTVYCQNLSKTYVEGSLNVPVFRDLNFSVLPGELVAIIGASGSGKSTLLQLLGGLDKPTAGEVFVVGKNLGKLSEKEKGFLRNEHLGFVYQFHHLLPEFNALENVCIPLLIRGVKPKSAKQKALKYIEQVGLLNRQKHRVGELSGGERQRIAIARALVTEPKCVLADEPTGNLDEKTAEQIVELLLQLNKRLSTSFVIVTHNRKLASKMDRILSLQSGNLIVEK
ncbi:lipoprotein-releasing ABC transporter ATP-binding protein LolD [Candidiatus Paracoxiella cheracis]|uniref:lipoprotein-releasing ABC transporter ATP-binding protein LolD n=1 Tax=Candidiatus Paracoxiella cheracis TaxID=3405120 RepID=UPI003BF5F583